jgi:hypothetical protein
MNGDASIKRSSTGELLYQGNLVNELADGYGISYFEGKVFYEGEW